ncbi:PREDICTED: protein FAM114A2 [Ceratosolen solmsi marchali]|uniref:Protein FAM114A2 n=1 Tax=Ceratosolen solmsi marchali TaxID=326594 RepID=A0AAJ7E0U8_9HYME|nr:PREDICTED: protein FAM114A2 [Ceratosolen solmsi marchali]
MATSESDDFESADEELNARTEQTNKCKKYTSIGSDSDDDLDYIPVQYNNAVRGSNKEEHKISSYRKNNSIYKVNDLAADIKAESKSVSDFKISQNNIEITKNKEKSNNINLNSKIILECENNFCQSNKDSNTNKLKVISIQQDRPQRQQKIRETQLLGVMKIGTDKIDKLPDLEITSKTTSREFNKSKLMNESSMKSYENKLKNKMKNEAPVNVPEELMSNLKFKDIFHPDGWESLKNDIEIPDLSDDVYHPIDKLSSSNIEQDNSNVSWSKWGNWGMTSLFNTATVGVSTLTSHVSHGLSFLEETMGVTDHINLVKSKNHLKEKLQFNEEKTEELKENVPSTLTSSFVFGNFVSSVSSITKLVESTSTKVISSGLDTLETIGKKTMEVLQEGDPGFKKKRALFLNDNEKPILSQILEEAKEKTDIEEKSVEEQRLTTKNHFESIFEDYQGLMHLEALEILSKQCNMKIQQQLINLDGSELTSMQETLDEVKDLCDLGDEEDENDEQDKKDLKEKLQVACKDLDISITYDKLVDISNDVKLKFSQENSKNMLFREVFQEAILSLAKFTGYSIERFHKTAELLLIKKHRSTVNEADCLIQLTNILSSQICFIANIHCYYLSNNYKNETNKNNIQAVLNKISLEATNASSYIQEAFKLLIPILQVGAI